MKILPSKIDKLLKRIALTEQERDGYLLSVRRRSQEPDPEVLAPVEQHLERLREQLKDEQRKKGIGS